MIDKRKVRDYEEAAGRKIRDPDGTNYLLSVIAAALEMLEADQTETGIHAERGADALDIISDRLTRIADALESINEWMERRG